MDTIVVFGKHTLTFIVENHQIVHERHEHVRHLSLIKSGKSNFFWSWDFG